MDKHLKFFIFLINPAPAFQFNWVVAAITAAAAAYSAYKGGQAADSATALSGKAARQQTRLARYQFERFKEFYEPIEERLSARALEGPDIEGALGRASTDVAVSFDKAADIEARRMGRYGIDPSMGRGRGMERELSQNRALAEVHARNLAREQEEDKSWARQLTMLQTGKGMPAQASAGLTAAGQAYGNLASVHSRQAQAAGGALGYWAQQAVSQYNQQPTYSAPATSAAGAGAQAGGTGAIPTSSYTE